MPITKVLIKTLTVDKSKMFNFSDFKSSYLTCIAPAKSMKLSIPSSNKSLKLIPNNSAEMFCFMVGKKFPTNNTSNDSPSDNSINPIEAGNFKKRKFK